MKAWPYPRWIAHRGAGKLAPENTLAAFRVGGRHGYRMFECDARLSADAVLFLLHDTTLERTTNGHGIAGEQGWEALAQLDAGGWHSQAFSGEPLPRLEAVAQFCLAHGHLLNIEIKPTPGTERQTGERVAAEAARMWAGQAVSPLLTSFSPDALAAARQAAPDLPRGLLLETLHEGWFERGLALDCTAIACHHSLWTADSVDRVHTAGLRCVAYTVNDAQEAARLLDLGVDSLITDAVDRLGPD